MNKLFLLALTLLFIHPQSAAAKELYGLAMVGEPKYGRDATHLDYANPDAPQGGTLRQAALGSFDTVNPYNIKGRVVQGLDLVTDRLMARVWDEPFTMYPMIAEKVDVPDDRSSATFTLNPKARFHDGSPITADDVLFSFETLRDKGRPNMRRVYKLATAEKLGERSVKFSFGEGYDRETVMIFAMMPILSKAYWTGKEFDATTLTPALGSGPYKVASVDPGRQIVLQKVKDYWAADLLPNVGHHNFDRVIYDYFRDDSVAFEAFKAQAVNFRREWDAGLWKNGYTFPAAKDGRVVQDTLKHGRPDRVRAFIFNTRRAPFDDIRVREALNLLFDFDWVNTSLYHGEYKRISSYYPNTELAAQREAAPAGDKRADLRKADALLKEAGWVIKDGKRVDSAGKPFTFEILLDDPGNEKVALALVRNLERMGITARVRVLDAAAFRGRVNEYDYDMTLYFWLSTLSPGTEQYLYWSCEAAKEPGRWNYAGVCDPKIDALAKAVPAAKDRAELVSTVHALDSALMAGQYMIPLNYNPVDYVSYWKPLHRPETVPLYGLVIETWWMDPAAKAGN